MLETIKLRKFFQIFLSFFLFRVGEWGFWGIFGIIYAYIGALGVYGGGELEVTICDFKFITALFAVRFIKSFFLDLFDIPKRNIQFLKTCIRIIFFT